MDRQALPLFPALDGQYVPFQVGRNLLPGLRRSSGAGTVEARRGAGKPSPMRAPGITAGGQFYSPTAIDRNSLQGAESRAFAAVYTLKFAHAHPIFGLAAGYV